MGFARVGCVLVVAALAVGPLRASAGGAVFCQADYHAGAGLLPDERFPVWELSDTADPADPELVGGVLRIATSAEAEDMSYLQAAPLVALPDPLVVEFRVRLVSGTSSEPNRAPIFVHVTTAENVGSLLMITVDQIFAVSAGDAVGASAPVDTDDVAHDYRIEVSGTTVQVYYDDVLALTDATFTNADLHGPVQRVSWGEGSLDSFGISEWESFRHNGIDPARCPLDAFLCDKSKATRGGPGFDAPAVALGAPGGPTTSYDVKKPLALCNPADVEAAGTAVPELHLEGYEIKAARGTPKPAPRQVLVANAFHSTEAPLALTTSRIGRLLVPTATCDDAPPGTCPDPLPAPDPLAHVVDHYRCSVVKVAKGAPKFVPLAGVAVADAFTAPPKSFDLKKPSLLCEPVEKTVLPGGSPEPVKFPDASLLCYRAKPAKGEPKHAKQAALRAANQFGAEQLDTTKEEILCVPSDVLEPS